MASIQTAVNGLLNYHMDEEIDHKAEFEKAAREIRTHSHRITDLREYWAAKRLDPQAQPEWRKEGNRKHAKRQFTPEQIDDMKYSADSLRVVAARNGTTAPTVAFFRLMSK